jgi:protein TonB
VLAERESMDAGFPGSVMLSMAGHLLLVGVAVASPLLFPTGPVLNVVEGFVVPLPRGGGGSSAPAAPPAVTPQAKPSEAPPEPVAPPVSQVAKPPKEEPRQGLPELDSKKSRRKPDPVVARGPAPSATTTASSTANARGTAGTSSATPGLDLLPPGVGVPEGVDSGGDWYLASVQQKIWMIWTQQIKSGFTQPVGVTFTIMADGTIADVRLTQPSGATMIDFAAQRAVTSAAPFGPLPKDYGTNRKTIQALFKPTS